MFDATPIENMFLIEYMPDAPEGYVRAYLYLRMVCIHPELCEDTEQMANALRMEPEAVDEALAYWEKEGLVLRVSDKPKRYEILPIRQSRDTEVHENIEFYSYRNFHAELQAIFGAEALERRHQLMAAEWIDDMHISQEAVLFLLKYELTQKGGKKPEAVFKRAGKRALDWADHGIHTTEEARRYVEGGSRIRGLCVDLLKRFNIRRAPTEDEISCAARWIETWKLSEEDIFEACTRTVNASNPSFGYLDKILESQVSGRDRDRTMLKVVLSELGMSAAPTPDMLRRYAEWRGEGFEQEALIRLAALCARNRYLSFDKLEKQVERFETLGMRSCAEIAAYIENSARTMAKRLEPAGITGLADIRLFEIAYEWQRLYEAEMIDAACARGRTLKGINDLLTSWKEQELTTPPAEEKTVYKIATPRFNYDQREYKEEDFGEDFFVDPFKDDMPEDKSK